MKIILLVCMIVSSLAVAGPSPSPSPKPKKDITQMFKAWAKAHPHKPIKNQGHKSGS